MHKAAATSRFALRLGVRPARPRRLAGLLVAAGLVAPWVPAGGCASARQSPLFMDQRDALARVNRNLARIDRPVQYKAFVSARLRDDSGAPRRFLGQEATLLFAAPRQLRFDIRSLAGVVAQFGSDGQRYWLWVEPEVRKLWWGSWNRLSEAAPDRLILPPEELLDALMLRPLPLTLDGGLAPLLRREDDDCRLLFVRLDPSGQTAGLREIRLDTARSFGPVEIMDRLPDGRVQMHVRLENYQPLEPGGPYTPRRYVITWPLYGTEMRIDVTRAQFRPDLPAEVFTFPRTWAGQVECLDAGRDQPQPDSASTGAPGL